MIINTAMHCTFTCPMAIFASPLLAASRTPQASGNGFLWILAAGLLVAVGAGVFFFVRYRSAKPLDSTRSLFHELCRTHNLGASQRNLLLTLSDGLKLPNPSALFIDSTLWRVPEAKKESEGLSKKEWDKLLTLQRTLFMPTSQPTNRPLVREA